MRTTIDLPDDVHAYASALARDTRKTLSEVVTELVRRGLTAAPSDGTVRRSPLTGLPVMSVGRPITTEDVRSLEDDL